LELVLNAPLDSVYDIDIIPLKFGATTTLGAGDTAIDITALPAFHGTPTTQLRVDYQGETIAHSSDTTMAPLRLNAYATPGLPGIADEIKDDLRRFTDYGEGQTIFGVERVKEIAEGLFAPNKEGRKPGLVIFEAGYGKPSSLADTCNHTSAFDLGGLSEDDQRRIITNHTAQLPQGSPTGLRHARPFSTLALS
jgi:hypothetical protein